MLKTHALKLRTFKHITCIFEIQIREKSIEKTRYFVLRTFQARENILYVATSVLHVIKIR